MLWGGDRLSPILPGEVRSRQIARAWLMLTPRGRPPCSSPRVRFISAMFHPNISPDGIPYVSLLLLWHALPQRQRLLKALLVDLIRLLVKPPDPEPVTHLNAQAASLFFSANDDERKDYQRRARRCAQRSNEE